MNSLPRSQTLSLVLPLPAASNNLYFTDKSGRRRLCYGPLAYKQSVAGFVAEEAKRQGFQAKRGEPLGLIGRIYLPNKRSDMTNRLKLLIDTIIVGLQNIGLDVDDRYVAAVGFIAMYDSEDPRVEVSMLVLPGWPDSFSPDSFCMDIKTISAGDGSTDDWMYMILPSGIPPKQGGVTRGNGKKRHHREENDE